MLDFRLALQENLSFGIFCWFHLKTNYFLLYTHIYIYIYLIQFKNPIHLSIFLCSCPAFVKISIHPTGAYHSHARRIFQRLVLGLKFFQKVDRRTIRLTMRTLLLGIIFESFASPWWQAVVVVWLFSIGPCFVSPLCLIYYLVIATFFLSTYIHSILILICRSFFFFLNIAKGFDVRTKRVCRLFSAHLPLNSSAHSTALSRNALHSYF